MASKKFAYVLQIAVVTLLILNVLGSVGGVNGSKKANTENFSEIDVKSLANSPWPMFHHDLNHAGLSPYETSDNLGKLRWKFQTGSGVDTPLAMGSDGTIYVGSGDYYLYAINKGPPSPPNNLQASSGDGYIDLS